MRALEKYFEKFREHIIGKDQYFDSPFGRKKIIYADWIASGRLYEPIERRMLENFAPFVANTHTETTITGSSMTFAYHEAKRIIKRHVKAWDSDVLISSNSGMTGVVNKFQRILGLKVHEKFRSRVELPDEETPIVFVSHMEHHSNQTSWLETLADVVVIDPTPEGLVDLNHLKALLTKYAGRKTKIAAVTSCSNVTGLKTPYHEIAAIMHDAGGLCFVDFACSAPYIDIEMRPDDPRKHLDAVYFSPHKFLGGPGTTGVLIFDPKLYQNRVPDNPGGGTVDWTNPWGGHKYIDEIEAREDGGTPAFLQTIKVALCIKLKEEMDVEKIHQRENELLEQVWAKLDGINNIHILAGHLKDRLGVVSFYIDNLHYNLGVKLLNDHFGIQVRGGCSCAGTYGHYLLHVSPQFSQSITDKISTGDLSDKPGWIRLSLHPVMTDEELQYILDAIVQLAENHETWAQDYMYIKTTNEFVCRLPHLEESEMVEEWFNSSLTSGL